MINLKDNSKIFVICISILVLSSFAYSFIVGEDALGGAERDFMMNNKFLLNFSENFKLAIQEYGIYGVEVRNLPVFNIILAQFLNLGLKISHLKYLNLLVLFPIIFYFIKSLKIKYINISFSSQILFVCIILLSPTIRSLVNYPFPFLWAICFFIMSIFFYLNFQYNKNHKFKNALYCILNLSLASYMTPNFAVFIIIYMFKFFLEYKISKKFLKICFFSFTLSLPALFFLIWKDFYIFKNEVFEVSYLEKFNIFNKIIIISSFITLYFIPFMIKLTKKDIFSKLTISKNLLYILSFFVISIFFFNFKNGAGGGIFYQTSNIIFGNNYFLYLVFLISLLIFSFFKFYNYENFLIFLILILYNPQYTIYYKYFDPLLLFVFLFIFNIKKNKAHDINVISKKYFIFYMVFLLLNIYKYDLRLLLI